MNHIFDTYHNIARRGALLMMALAALCGCTSDDPMSESDDTSKHQTAYPYIVFGVDTRGNDGLDWLPEVTSRAMKDPIPAELPVSIGVFGYNNQTSTGLAATGVGEVFKNVEMFLKGGQRYDEYLAQNPNSRIDDWFDDNDWPYENRMPWLRKARYKFFAYAPYDPDNVEARAQSYGGFSRIVWQHIPRFSAGDHMVSNKIVSYTSLDLGEGKNPAQKVYMRHLQSRVRFCFMIGDEFGKKRIIRVKKVELIDLRGHLLTLTLDFENDVNNDVFSVAEGTWGYPMTNALWSIETENIVPDDTYNVELENDLDNTNHRIPYVELSAETAATLGYQPLASAYVFPLDDIKSVKIRVTYDVYDREMVLLRQDDRAENNINLDLIGSLNAPAPPYNADTHVLDAGYYYDVNIKVEPDYLYVLSDNDFSANGYLIIKP